MTLDFILRLFVASLLGGSDSITIAVVGNIFIFLGVITNTLAKVFGFITLEYIHGNLSNEFSDLETEFRNVQIS